MKKTIVPVLVFLAILTGCDNDQTSDSESSNDNQSSSSLVESETSTTSSDFEVESNPDLLTYKYDSERPIWILVPEANELMRADGNYATMVVMESVINNDYRQELQNKYDEGYAFWLEKENDVHTGNIEMNKPEHETEILAVGLDNLDYEMGKEAVDKLANQQKEELEAQLVPEENSGNAEVNNYDEAVAKIQEDNNQYLDTETYTFYDFGPQNDGRDYFEIMIRNNQTAEEVYARVYGDNGEVSYR